MKFTRSTKFLLLAFALSACNSDGTTGPKADGAKLAPAYNLVSIDGAQLPLTLVGGFDGYGTCQTTVMKGEFLVEDGYFVFNTTNIAECDDGLGQYDDSFQTYGSFKNTPGRVMLKEQHTFCQEYFCFSFHDNPVIDGNNLTFEATMKASSTTFTHKTVKLRFKKR